MSLDDYKVVSTETVRQHLSTLESNPASFLKGTGAEKIIRGNVYTGGDDLIIQTRIVDAESGEIEFAFPEISRSASDITGLVEELRERLLSYFLASANPQSYASGATLENPPKYEAYKAYQEGRSFFGNDYEQANMFFEKAIAIDPEYFWPYFDILVGFSNRGRVAEADSMLEVINRRFDRFLPYEQLYYEWAKTILTNDLEAQYQATQKLFTKDPREPVSNYLMASIATGLNRPNEAITYYQYLDYTSFPISHQAQTW